MRNNSNLRMRSLLVALTAFGLVAAACSDDDTASEPEEEVTTTVAVEDDAMEDEAMEEDAMEDDAMEDEAMEDDAMEDEAMEEEAMEDEAMEEDAMADTMGAMGPGCEAVPADGEGSFAGMSDDPAATAASNNPVLSTLVGAVMQAELVDTLNSEGPFTIFAPTNDAFAAVPADSLDAVLADNELLTSVLTYHVVAGEQYDAQGLIDAGTLTTVNGADLTFAADGDGVSINGAASAICWNVPTANATVHIIDSVLLPG